MARPQMNVKKVTLNMVAGDKEILERYYPNCGWSVAARQILHRHCQRLEALARQGIHHEPEEDDDGS